MKNFYLECVILFLMMLISSCSEDNPIPEVFNEAPIIEVITQIDATEIIIGPTIVIETDISDNDGSINEVKFFMNNIEVETIKSSPFNFSWDTQSGNEGVNILKIVAFDDKGSSTIIEKQIILSNHFTCGNDFFDPRDGNIYKTVQIGEQCWMAQNLNYKTEKGSWDYDNKEENGKKYGKLYTWQTSLEVSPDGWHLPTDDEWNILEATVDSKFGTSDYKWDIWDHRGYDVGKNLKSTSGWNEKGNGTDLFGFNAKPGGYSYRTYGDNGALFFENLGWSAPFWTATSFDTHLWAREIYSSKDTVLRYWESSFALSVRCIKD